MLEKTGLPPDAAARYPAQFSGGQRQRVGHRPGPDARPRGWSSATRLVSALDLSVQAQILNLLGDLQQETGLSYLFISHDLEVVRHLCDRVVVLYRGRVMESGPGQRVMTDPAHPYTDELLVAAPVPDPRRQRARQLLTARAAAAAAAAEVRGASDHPVGAGCPFSDRCQHAVGLCREQAPPLRPAGAGPESTGVSVACHRYPEWLTEKTRQARRPETPDAGPHPGASTVPAHKAG